jgi:hypothetical protein
MLACRVVITPPNAPSVEVTALDSSPAPLPWRLGGTRHALPYPGFSDSAPLRLTFVGQSTYFRSCALGQSCPGIEPTFVDYRAGADPGAMLSALEGIDPDVVIAFRPEIFPAGTFSGLDAITLGYLTEPLPRQSVDGSDEHPDLTRRLGYLDELDPTNFDRILSFDPLMTDAAETRAPIWRSLPLPVADEYFAPVPAGPHGAQALFVGRSTEHREMFLVPVKHDFDVMHIAHGATDALLRDFLIDSDVGINLHNENYPTFENRCATILAAGNLLISERLSPTHGLEPSLDFIQIALPEELYRALHNVGRAPDAFRRMRFRGRQKAEYFRASHVYPRLVRDLILDVRTFGRGAGRGSRSGTAASL